MNVTCVDWPCQAGSGLNPKITVWTDKADKSMDTIRELGRAVVPMLDTIETQTGYKLPDWMLEHQQAHCGRLRATRPPK